MKRLSDNHLLFLLPLTLILAVTFSIFTVIAFRLNAVATGFVLAIFSLITWIVTVTELFLLYDRLVERWFTKDRSVVTAVWFVVSIFIAITFTPDKHLDWSTIIVSTSLFAVIFLLPYIICMAYGERITAYIRQRWTSIFIPHSRITEDKESEEMNERQPFVSPIQTIKREDEVAHYEELIAAVPSAAKAALPERLRTGGALFLLVLFQEDGYLDNQFKPTIKKEDGAINQTLYAYLADAIASALNIKQGKWKIFEEFWSIKNGAQLVTNYKTTWKDEPTEHQRRIDKVLRKATRLCPRLDTVAVRDFKNL